MKTKLIILFVLFLMSAESQAQICKYVVNEKDPLTDDVIRTVRTRITGPKPYYYFSYIRNGSDYKLFVEVGDYGELDNTIPKDSELIMRVGNGNIYRMKAIGSAKPEVVKDFSDRITQYEITYQMTEQNMRDIQESGVVFIRIQDLKNTFSDQQIPDAVVQISKANAECIFK